MGKLLKSDEAARLVGGHAKLTRLIRTGRLAFCQVGLGNTLASMRFLPDDIADALAATAEPKEPTVYITGFGGYVKIGFTTDLPGRLIDLEDHLPAKLTLYASFPGTMADERALHARFASCRTKGEWFLKRGKLRDWIAAGCPHG